MKKVNLLIILMFFLLVCKGQSLLEEGNSSFIKLSKVWVVAIEACNDAQNLLTTSIYYKFIGDTVVGDFGYTKMYTSTKVDRSGWKLDSYWREDESGKIFIRRPGENEKFIYNFNLGVGDTIHNEVKALEAVVDSISMKPFGSENRKYLYSHQVLNPTHDLIWIEGVGSLIAPTIYNGTYITGGTYILSCFEEDGQLVYHNPKFSTCFVEGPKVPILDASLKWNIGMHCVNPWPINPYDKWATSFLHIEGDTLMNNKYYKKLVSCADSLCKKENLKSYIREKAGKIWLANKTEELTLYDFNLQKGDTMILDFLQDVERKVRLYIRVDSVKSMVLQDRKERIAQYVTVFDYYNSRLGDYSINDVFVEGIGSLKFGLEYPMGLFVTGGQGCYPTVLCFSSGDGLIYSNPTINSCYMNSDEMKPEFAPVGAEWYYCVPNVGGNPLYSYERYVVGGDTVVDGKTCRIIKSQNFMEVMYEKNNKVYYHFNNKFRLIYDFGVSVGDTVGFDFKSFSPNSLLIDTTYVINCVVRQIDTLLVNNKKLRRISTSVIQNDSLTHIVWPAVYTYLESVGFEYDFMFILPIPSLDYMHNLRCYNDENIIYSTEWWKGQNRACDFSLLNSIPRNTLSNKVSFFPNPVTNELFVKFSQAIPESFSLELYSINGELVKIACIDGHSLLFKLDIGFLKSGIYILHLISASGKYSEEVIIKK